MHLYSRAVGLETESAGLATVNLHKEIIDRAIKDEKVIYNNNGPEPDGGFYEAQVNCGMMKSFMGSLVIDRGGLTIRGLYNPKTKEFTEQFYYPYITGRTPRYNAEVLIERQADKEAYMVHCNEPKREVTPIFFMKNIVEYLKESAGTYKFNDIYVYMSALAREGKIILPVKKTDDQIEKCKAAAKERESLVDKALQGDQDAIDNLTIGDYDTLNSICKRAQNEDIFSIVDTSFIPSGLECDCYSVIGNILSVELLTNDVTGEEIYYMSLECNDLCFDLGINRRDLYGIPEEGRRFVGKIWLQGDISYEKEDE